MNALMKDPEAASGKGAFLQVEQPDAANAGTADNLASFEALKVKAQEALQREKEQEKKEVNEFMVEKQSLMGAMTLFNSKCGDLKAAYKTGACCGMPTKSSNFQVV